jgi:hypothetical protein
MNNALLFFLPLVISLVGIQSANAQQITSIPSGMHKCIDLVITTNSFLIGLHAAQGNNGNLTATLDKEVASVEGCVLHWERLFPNG